jgi:uncharacterized damage-inducible protein DinB
MSRPILSDAFSHHVWASLRVIDASLPLTDAQRAGAVPGTYGSILDTIRHLVGADRWYLVLLSGGTASGIDEDSMDLPAMRHGRRSSPVTWTPTWTSSSAEMTARSSTRRWGSGLPRRSTTGQTTAARCAPP